jgi:hypothetical protein
MTFTLTHLPLPTTTTATMCLFLGGNYGGAGPAQEHLRPQGRDRRQQPRVSAAQRVWRRLSHVLRRGTFMSTVLSICHSTITR